jgi:transcriptional regulator with XRE-family HTH domain
MGTRPSTPLLKLLREAARKKGWNTSTLAQHAGIDRGHLKQVLAGREALTVDELIQLSEAMALTPTDLGMLGGATLPEEPTQAATPALASVTAPAQEAPFPDPFGIQAEQVLRLGFALGVDVFLLLDTAQLKGSGVPMATIKRFQPNLPIRLESAYHRYNAPEYFPEGCQLRLSFDSVYTCLIPWGAIQHITLYPLAPELEEEPEEEPEESPPSRGGFLRLVD